VFDRSTKLKAGRSYRLLILDGHGSHVTMDFIEYCDNHRILLCIFAPHSTHTLQPLDVVMFKPLSCQRLDLYCHQWIHFGSLEHHGSPWNLVECCGIIWLLTNDSK